MNTETKHTPEKLPAPTANLIRSDGSKLFSVHVGSFTDGRYIFKGASIEDATRLVTCWNAHDDMAKEIAKLRADKVELIHAITEAVERNSVETDEWLSQQLRNLIAKHAKATLGGKGEQP